MSGQGKKAESVLFYIAQQDDKLEEHEKAREKHVERERHEREFKAELLRLEMEEHRVRERETGTRGQGREIDGKLKKEKLEIY